MNKTTLSLGILLSLSGASLGCSDGSRPGSATKLLVQGRVDADIQAESSSVEAYELGSDGSREPVEGEPSSVDSSGRYRFESGTELTAGTHIVLEASDGTNHASVVVRVDADGEMRAEPMNEETSLEADVFGALLASGGCEDCSHEAVRASIDAELAATFEGASQSEAALADISAAVEARITAESAAITQESSAAFEAFASARASAYASEVVALDAAASASATQQAHADYAEAIAEARTSAGITATLWAESAHAGAEAARMEAERVELDAALFAQVVANAELERAAAVQAAMQAELEASGVTSVELAPIFAALTLAIGATRADGALASEGIANAWASVAVDLRAAITASMDEVQTAAFESWATFSATLLATLRAQAEASADSSVGFALALTSLVADASVDLSALTGAGMDAAQAEAYASLLLHAELGASAH